MFEIVFLGTSASAPSIERGLPATMLMYRDQRFLVDCGEGTQRQLLRSGLGFKRLDKVLLTHGHLDHILGLGGLVSTFARWEAISQFSIYGGRWALERVRDLMDVVLRGGEPALDISYVEVTPGPIWSDDTMTITAFPVTHRGPGCYGFLFQERTRRPFLAEKAAALGIPAGPERRQLVAGQPVTLPDGRTVYPEQVLGEPVPGTRLAYVGDAGEVSDLVEAVKGADALVIEATYLEAERELAAEYGHITAAQAAALAREAGVHCLFLVHLSRRHSERAVLAEAQPIFPNSIVPRDLDHYRVLRGVCEAVE
ncbi:MAG: ribonuclease Z [Anaerolineae bacterium]|nr:ribonuclease Z [Anaerolineae bacterium]